MWYIHTIEGYSAVKGNEVLIHATGMNLENMRLSERSQPPKTTCCMIPFLEMSRIGNARDRRYLSCLSVGEVEEGWC